VRRLLVRRQFAGGGISSVLLSWAVERARSLHRDYLRLDCEASRPKLGAVTRDLVLSITATDKLVHISFRGMSIESRDWNHPSLFSRSAKGTVAGTLSDSTAWQSNLRFHRET
jgi:hypothetical protein